MTEDPLTLLALTGAAACGRACLDLEDAAAALGSVSDDALKVWAIVRVLEAARDAPLDELGRRVAEAADALDFVIEALQSQASPKMDRASKCCASAMVALFPLRRAWRGRP